MYCTKQMIQWKNFCNWLKYHENHKSFPPQNIYRAWYVQIILEGDNYSKLITKTDCKDHHAKVKFAVNFIRSNIYVESFILFHK